MNVVGPRGMYLDHSCGIDNCMNGEGYLRRDNLHILETEESGTGGDEDCQNREEDDIPGLFMWWIRHS